MNNPEKHIEAEVRFLSREEGGRNKLPFSGYRPQFYYDGRDWDASLYFDSERPIKIGEVFTATFTFVHPEYHQDKLFPGKEFQLREADQVVATGRVINVLWKKISP